MCARNNWAYWPQPVSLGTSAIKRPHSGNLVATNQLFCLLGAVASRYWPTWRHREDGHALRSARPKAHKIACPSMQCAPKYANITLARVDGGRHDMLRCTDRMILLRCAT